MIVMMMMMQDVDQLDDLLPQSASAYQDSRSAYSCQIFHEMVERRPLSLASQYTEVCQQLYRKRNVEPDPCCSKLKLYHKSARMLLLQLIGQLRSVFSLECYPYAIDAF